MDVLTTPLRTCLLSVFQDISMKWRWSGEILHSTTMCTHTTAIPLSSDLRDKWDKDLSVSWSTLFWKWLFIWWEQGFLVDSDLSKLRKSRNHVGWQYHWTLKKKTSRCFRKQVNFYQTHSEGSWVVPLLSGKATLSCCVPYTIDEWWSSTCPL